MDKRIYEVELLTPCFCGGAKPNEIAEIRAPSIRGQLRWWFRALNPSLPVAEEKRLFGGIHGDALAGLCVVRVPDPPRSNRNRVVNVSNYSKQVDSGISYLLFTLSPTFKKSESNRGVLDPGVRFRVMISGKTNQQLPENFWRAVEAWFLLGALGARSRRGMGSMRPLKRDNETWSPASLEDFQSECSRVLSDTDIFVKTIARPASSYALALESLGNWLKHYRDGTCSPEFFENDHKAGLRDSDHVYRPVIGLPLRQRYRIPEINVDTILRGKSRWASPVHLRVIRCGTAYQPIAIFFPDMAMPDGQTLTLKNDNNKHQWSVNADRGLFDQMMTPLPDEHVLHQS